MFNAELLAFILYFALVLGIGIYFFAKTKGGDEKDYFLGGRSMGPWVTAMSAQASDMSAWLLMGLPGSILAFGLGQAWIGIGLAIGTALNWIFVAKRLRKFSKASGDAITFPQYLSNRFATTNPTLKIVCAIIFLISFTIYVASGFSAGASVFTELFPGLDPNVNPDIYPGTALMIFAAIILVYTLLGGFKAVCWTDFFQGLLMLAALIAVPLVVVFAKNLDKTALTTVFQYTDAKTGEIVDCAFTTNLFNATWQEIVSGLGWGLGYFGMPHILVRFMSIEKPSMVKKSATVAIIWVVISLFAAIAIAYLGRMVVGAELLGEGLQKLVFVRLARNLFPGFIAGILLAAIIAASMSTADSQLLVASSSFTSDIYKPIIRKKASDKETLWVGRIVVLVVAVIAYFIAGSHGKGAQAIMDMVENAWGLFGAAFGPVVLLSLFWKRYTYKGALAGIITGAIVDILWLNLMKSTGVYEIVPAFIIGLIVSVIVTLMDKEPSKEVAAIFDKATDPSNDD